MKRLFPLVISLIIMLCSAAAIAAPVYYEGISLEKIAPYTVGKWCDESGHHWVDLTPDRINGVRISNAENIEINGSDGSADLIIADISGDWTLKVTWHNGDDGRYITLDGLKLVPMKNQAPVCETIGGIYLDMSQDALKRVYGQGNILSDEQVYDMCGVNCDGWYYPNNKLIITIDYRVDGTRCWFELKAKHKDWLWGYITESAHIALPTETEQVFCWLRRIDNLYDLRIENRGVES